MEHAAPPSTSEADAKIVLDIFIFPPLGTGLRCGPAGIWLAGFLSPSRRLQLPFLLLVLIMNDKTLQRRIVRRHKRNRVICQVALNGALRDTTLQLVQYATAWGAQYFLLSNRTAPILLPYDLNLKAVTILVLHWKTLFSSCNIPT